MTLSGFGSLVLLFPLLASISNAKVKPGDLTDWKDEPDWWHDLKDNKYGPTLKKCVFETKVPDTGQHCPGVATHQDHYFCIYGSDTAPEWFCTCLEVEGDYVFHCNDQHAKTPEELAGIQITKAPQAPPTPVPSAATPVPTFLLTDAPPPPPAASPQQQQQQQQEKEVTLPPGLQPGDWLDLSQGEPRWWHNMKIRYDEELRKCVFESRVPNDGESCPDVDKTSDHYFCVFGTDEAPTWFCTCREIEGDFKFHCNHDELRTPEEIEKTINVVNPVTPSPTKPKTPTLAPTTKQPSGSETTGSSRPGNTPTLAPTVKGTSPPVSNTAPAQTPQTTSSGSDEDTVHPGDPFDWRTEPQWWHDLKPQYEHQLRKCVFLNQVPDTGDSCPGVASDDNHYYCIWGSDTEPQWYCTCLEKSGDYVFHCNTERVKHPDEIKAISIKTDPPSPPTPAPSAATPVPTIKLVLDEKKPLSSEAVAHGGDVNNFANTDAEPQWWHFIKDRYGDELRKCVFEKRFPDTGDFCPGDVNKGDHYYCVFGTAEAPTWFCTCVEADKEYKFHCNRHDLMTPAEIAKEDLILSGNSTLGPDVTSTDDDLAPEAEVVPAGRGRITKSFLPGLFAGMFFVILAIKSYQHCEYQRQNKLRYRPPSPPTTPSDSTTQSSGSGRERIALV